MEPVLSVRDIFMSTYTFLWRNRSEFFKRAPLVFAVLVFLMWGFGRSGPDATAVLATNIAGIVAVTVLMMHFTVAWHRLVLFGPAEAGGPLRIRFGLRELKFFGCSFLSNFVDKISEKIIDGVWENAGETPGFVVSTVLLVVIVYFTLRLCLALPVIAADQSPAFGRAWELSRGRFWKMLLSGVAVFVPLLIGWGLLFSAIIAIEVGSATFVGIAAYFTVVVAVVATFLSTVYLRLTEVGIGAEVTAPLDTQEDAASAED